MNQIISQDKNIVKFNLEVSAEEFAKAVEAAYKKNRAKFNIQGFRKGKATKAMIEKLYGEEYQTFTKVQKAYLEKNLNNFQVITQRVLTRLGYPPLAAKLKIGGANVIEFMFHPDGSITNLRVTNSSGYEVFDKYSLELIEIAYKDYPRPTTSTKLKFNVRYQLY